MPGSVRLLVSNFESPHYSAMFALVLPPAVVVSAKLIVPVKESLPASTRRTHAFTGLVRLNERRILLEVRMTPVRK